MNTVLFVLANLGVAFVIIWSIQNDRRKGDDTEGVIAIRRTKVAAAPPETPKGRIAPGPRRRRN
jgi:hypothetical protein